MLHVVVTKGRGVVSFEYRTDSRNAVKRSLDGKLALPPIAWDLNAAGV